MLSWEYPPSSVGGLAKHVEELSEALSKKSVEIHVLTVGKNHAPKVERKNNLWIYRVEPYPLQTPNFLTWIQHLNYRFIEEAINLINTWGPFNLIHCHDWLVGFTGKVLKNAYKIPLVATIHATEAGRNHGLHTAEQHYINQIEWWLTYEAWRVIVCSQHMVQEANKLFNLPLDKIRLVPNGIDLGKFRNSTLKNVCFGPDKIVFFIGRLVREKGVQVLLEAAPEVIKSVPDVHFFIAGKGPMEAQLKEQAKNLGLESHVSFLGYIEEEMKIALYTQAQAAVFPSLYEPFGIVVLEAMAAGAPVVVSDTGGMAEIVKNEFTGLKVAPGNPKSLAKNLIKLLQNQELGERLKTNGLVVVKKQYDWGKIAEKTKEIYLEILLEFEKVPWGSREFTTDKSIEGRS